MSSSDVQARVGKALVDFAVKSRYPDEEVVIAADVESLALPVALELLSNAKASLEDEIRKKSQEAAPDVDSWIEHAKALQDDIESSKRLASDIIRQAEEDEHRGEVVSEQEAYLSFIGSEVAFNSQLYDAILIIQEVSECLDRAEALINVRQILPCLTALELAWTSIAKIPASRTARTVRLLDAKCSDLRETAVDLLRSIWEALVVVDREGGQITINKKLDGEATAMDAAILSLISLHKLQEEAKQFWNTLDEVILKPRSDLSRRTLRCIEFEENTVRLGPEMADSTIKSLFVAMEDLVRYLVEHLPPEFIKPLSDAMMPDLSARLKEFWLDTAVPSALDDILEYQKSLAQVQAFVDNLESLYWPGSDKFEDWIFDAPKIWINKRRENALDWTRNQLELGIGNPQLAEHVERRIVGKDEGKQIASTVNMVTQEWDAAWDSEEEEPVPLASNRASLEEERRASEVTPAVASAVTDDDDAADAWGWGDEDAVDQPTAEDVGQPASGDNQPNAQSSPETREVTLSETYYSSSIPQPLFKTIAGIFNDGARLTSPEFDKTPVTGAAPGLFNLPTLVLAMYRAVSPFHYARHQSGNMFAYNDSIWLCDKLRDFQSEWERRTDLSSRAFGKVKLGPEVKNLESFGKRAYTNELTSQRTVITDLLGGAQNFFQEDGNMKGDLEAEIDAVVTHIRTVAAAWKPILAYSAWASSVGSLVNAVASKLITDVFDLNDVSVDEAERIATIIAKVTKFDDLFIPPSDPQGRNNSTNGEYTEPVPMTARFADKWMKLQFLSEVLQSNLNDIKFFWFESDLSLYFTAEEVVELIGLSFENNANVRQAKREIKERPRPRVE